MILQSEFKHILHSRRGHSVTPLGYIRDRWLARFHVSLCHSLVRLMMVILTTAKHIQHSHVSCTCVVSVRFMHKKSPKISCFLVYCLCMKMNPNLDSCLRASRTRYYCVLWALGQRRNLVCCPGPSSGAVCTLAIAHSTFTN